MLFFHIRNFYLKELTMKKRLSTILLSFLLSMVLLATTISNSYAQELGAAGEVTLADLGESEITLNGPFDTSSVQLLRH